MKYILTLALLLTFAVEAQAKSENYTLVYKKENRWVAKEDAKGLRALLKKARKVKHTNFLVQLPTEKRDVAIERLMVLRDILEQQVGSAVTIEETDGKAEMNNIIVSFK